MNIDYNNLHKDVLSIVDKASAEALENFNMRTLQFKNKVIEGTKDVSIVTEIDKKLNAYFKDELFKLLPEAGFLGEESNNDFEFKTLNWIVDPIDGTSNYYRGSDMWGISVALWEKNNPIYSLQTYPRANNELFYFIHNKGTFNKNNIKIDSSNFSNDYKKVYTVHTLDSNLRNKLINFDFGFKTSYRSYGALSYDTYCLLQGSLDFVVAINVGGWDIAGSLPLVTGAGLNYTYLTEKISVEDPNFKEYTHKVLIGKTDVISSIEQKISSLIQP